MRRSLVLLLLSACGGSAKLETRMESPVAATAQEKQDMSRCDSTGKRIVRLDLNKDDKADVYKLFASRDENGQPVEYLVCKEVDINFDGRKDVWIYYGDDGTRAREEMDLDFDGRIDLVTLRQADKVVRQELDTDFDGRSDIVRHFEGEKIARVERDSDQNGKVDYWEYYEGGLLDRVGYDLDGNGSVDRWDRAPPPEVPATPPAAATPAAATSAATAVAPK